ncbi:MAG: serine hydrolase [Planctomycetia bacterium]|nr:serine hydrolase [Planctomycetia bacterium]
MNTRRASLRWSHSLARTLIAVACLAVAGRANAQTFEERIKPLIDAHAGQVTVAVKHLDKGDSFNHQADEPMPTASLIKLAVMVEAYRQAHEKRLDLAKHVTLKDEDKVPGSGILTSHFSAGASISVRDAIRLMIAFSDNTATNLVLDQIGLPATAKCMEELGCSHTKIHSKVFKRETSVFPERSKEFGLGSTTAGEMVRLLELIHQRKLVSPEASDAMKEHLLACDDKLKFRRLIPAAVKIAHKTGSVDEVRTDAGIIYSAAGPLAVCVLTRKNKDTRWADDNAGDVLCAQIARAVFDHFNPPAPKKAQPSDDAVGWVEPCEAHLRAGRWASLRSTHPTLSQKAGGAEEEDPEDDPRAAAPLPELQPRDTLNGQPFLACQAWAVADAQTGKVLWESQGASTRDTASTTKIMTAHVILKLADSSPKILDELVVFSDRADKTAGSAARLRSGDRIPVRELLYGLLLPSGNDAAVALAEHFGARFEPPSQKHGHADPVARFVAEMNRTAAKLKMSDTKYLNPNGLPEKGHASSVRDLVKVTSAALQNRIFRECVACRQHEAQVTARDGSKRTVVWKTTNRLLAIAGYSGVKTGWTKAAGSCLVSTGQRGKDSLIVVVLGAPSAAAAVADSRNLYRWAWRERGHKE